MNFDFSLESIVNSKYCKKIVNIGIVAPLSREGFCIEAVCGSQ